ncbi:MAG: hypothetical protein ABIJ23_03960 [Candidatus Magasanikbacteria bacterium]
MKEIIISLIIGLFSLICLLIINNFPTLWIFIPVFSFWLLVLIITFVHYNKKAGEKLFKGLSLVIFSSFSFVGLISLLEIVYLRLFLIILAGFIMFFIFFYSLKQKKSLLSYVDKPYRRMLMMLWAFNVFCFVTFGFALNIFFTSIPFWIISFLVSLFTAYMSMMVWLIYFDLPIQNFLLRGILALLVVWEVMWVIHFLPLGFLALGGLVVWVWYLLQLFVRFHLSKQGVAWSKQIVFLLSNLVLYFLVLYFFVRWI